MLASDAASVLLLTGPPGVGKTTVAEVLAGRWSRCCHLETDQFFRNIRTGYIEPWQPQAHQQNETVMRIVASAASEYARAGFFTIVEGIIIPGWFFEPLCNSLEVAGHVVTYAVLRAPLDLCLARATGRRSKPLAELGAIEQIWHQFAQLGPLESGVIEVATKSADEIADLVAQRVEAPQPAAKGDI